MTSSVRRGGAMRSAIGDLNPERPTRPASKELPCVHGAIRKGKAGRHSPFVLACSEGCYAAQVRKRGGGTASKRQYPEGAWVVVPMETQ